MTVTLNPYLSFRGNAREAITFYKSVFGGELAISTFDDYHASQDPSDANLVMHSMLTGDNGLTLMASDTPRPREYNPGDNISMSLSGATSDEPVLRGYWDKLIDGGTVTMPLEKAVWGDTFGMCVDKFGIAWLVNIAGAPS
ncbi:VOC family protein [Lacisediminihabitans profunda]|uniref:VOC family protein n=1 Tax=Lacisediminihabitans profunda TaxID=2594790 RepID=A0A5C8ULF8_9MICO|nr:VOC family protein [Lacisediminihabitans profunda]TXN29162.1 VOC family protein [Lacisediminihabitans profunda]